MIKKICPVNSNQRLSRLYGHIRGLNYEIPAEKGRLQNTRVEICRISGLAALLSAGIVSSATAADYRLNAGDSLEFSVAGSPELHRILSIDLDGSVSLPLIGEIPVAGRTLADVRTDVRTLIAQRDVPQRGAGSQRGATYVVWPLGSRNTSI